jgi:predicted nucleic acid-binding protein
VAREVFADTAFFAALLDPRDTLNEEAIALAERLARDGARMATTDAILVETANFCARGPLRGHAARWIEELRADTGWYIIPLDRPTLLRAEVRYARHADKAWSLTDCHTMEAPAFLGRCCVRILGAFCRDGAMPPRTAAARAAVARN